MLNPAAVPDFKEELKYLLEWFNTQLNKLGIQPELGKEVTAEMALQMEPDAVIVATGATPIQKAQFNKNTIVSWLISRLSRIESNLLGLWEMNGFGLNHIIADQS